MRRAPFTSGDPRACHPGVVPSAGADENEPLKALKLAGPGRTVVFRHEGGGEGSAARHGGVQRRAAAGTGRGKWAELTLHCQIWLPR